MNFSLDDIVLVSIPFTDLTSSKVRPAVIVGFAPNGTDLFVAPGTSILLNADLLLEEWGEAGLNVPTGLKAQLATVESTIVRRVVGQLSHLDTDNLTREIRSWLHLDSAIPGAGVPLPEQDA